MPKYSIPTPRIQPGYTVDTDQGKMRVMFEPVPLERLQEVVDAWFRAYPPTPEMVEAAREGDKRLAAHEFAMKLKGSK